MTDLLVFLGLDLLASGMVVLLFYLRSHPAAPLFPDALKHRWCVGLIALTIPFIAFPLPLLLSGQPVAALVATLMVFAGSLMFGGELIEGIRQDVREHRVEGRSFFTHSHDCLVQHTTEGEGG